MKLKQNSFETVSQAVTTGAFCWSKQNSVLIFLCMPNPDV